MEVMVVAQNALERYQFSFVKQNVKSSLPEVLLIAEKPPNHYPYTNIKFPYN